MVSLWEGLQREVLGEFEDATTNTITVVAGRSFNPFAPSRSDELPGFTDSDIAFFAESMGFVTEVTPVAEIDEDVAIQGQQVDSRIIAGSQAYLEIEWWDIIAGRSLSPQDLRFHTDVAVVSENFVRDYLERTPSQALWNEITIGDQYFSIVGVSEAPWGGLIDVKAVVIPISTAQQKITTDPFYPYLIFEVDPQLPSSQTIKLVKYTLLKRQWATHMDDALFQVISTETMVQQIQNVSSLLQMALAGIGGVALLVGGIGVMNIMLVSVTERTREIGIRKAIWATYRDILMQFLSESVLLGLLWCLIGVLLSRGIIALLQYAGVPALLNLKTIMIAVLFAWGTGVIFWVGPARKAAKMKPIDALRYE